MNAMSREERRAFVRYGMTSRQRATLDRRRLVGLTWDQAWEALRVAGESPDAFDWSRGIRLAVLAPRRDRVAE